MQIVLLILKIIGILLLILLGLAVVLLLTVLFVPVRYKLSGYHLPDRGTALHGRVSWLMSVLRADFGYEGEGYLRIRVFGILWKGPGSKKEPPSGAEKAADRPKAAPEPVSEPKSMPEPTPESMPVPKSISKPVLKAVPKPAPEPSQGAAYSAEGQEQPASGQNALRRRWEQLRRLPERFRQWKRSIRNFLQSFREKKERLNRLLDFLRLPEVKETLRLCLRQIKGLLKHIGPRKIYLKGRFGFDDPALTGQVTGILSMLPVVYREGISLTPDFTEACLEGEFSVQGRVRAASLLALALKIWFDENFRKAYQKWKEM